MAIPIPTETWQHRDIMTNGIRMHYVTQGNGPLIVLMHGFPEFWFSWRHQIPALADLGYTVVAPDLRGYNDTDKPRTGYDVPNLLLDIKGLIVGLGFREAVIVGHDWGGALAWAFADRYPELTSHLIVLNAPNPAAMQRDIKTPEQRRKSWYILAFQIPWLPEFILLQNHAARIGELIQMAAYQKAAFPDEVLDFYREAMSKPGAMTASINYYRQLKWSLNHNWQQMRLSMPTLLIWGEQDTALGISLTEGLEQWVPGIHIHRISDSGHWVQQEKPELVNQFLIDFLRKP